MNINRDSLIAALSEYALRDLPDVDDGQSVWIKAIALVRKKDGTSSYVCVKKEPYTFCNVVLKDFGTCSAIADFEELGKTDKFFADLAEICKRNNGIWSDEAEKYILANAKKI